VKVNVTDVSGCAKEVHVEVPAEAVQEKVDALYKQISSEAKEPGFRKGKVPMDVIKKKYKANVRDEIVHHHLPEFFRAAMGLTTIKLEPVAQPQITHLQFEEGSPMKFVATVEVKPEIKLKDYKGIKIKKESTGVKEEEVDRALDGLKDQAAEFIPVTDRAAKQDDLVVVDFDGKIGGKPFDGGKAHRYPVLLGAQGLLKDFESNLMGMKLGETKTFKITFPKDYGKAEVAGKEAEFTVSVKEIKEKKIPMVDNDFAKKVAQVDTVKALREKIEAGIKSQKELDQRAKMVGQIGEKLIADHPFDIPVSLINLEQQRLVQQGVDRLRQQGVDVAKLTADQRKEFVEKLRPVAEKNVHMALIVERIANQENIKCEDKDFEAYAEKIGQNLNQSTDNVKKYLQQKGNMDSIQEWIQYEKTLDFLISQAKVEAA